MRLRRTRSIAALLGTLLASACAPARTTTPAPAPVGLPPIPTVEGPLEIRVVHPTPTTPLPRVDSTYIYGSVGSGRASLTINGTPVEVAPNGAFVAYLPVPQSGTWELAAQDRGRTTAASVSYRVPQPAAAPSGGAPAGGAAPAAGPTEFAPARAGMVTGGADTLATGSEVVVGRPTPTGTYRWFLPRGARVQVVGRTGDQLRVRLGDSTAWFPADGITLADTAAPAPAMTGRVSFRPHVMGTDVRLPVNGAPFGVETTDSTVALHVYGVSAPGTPVEAAGDPVVAGGRWTAVSPQSARLDLRLAGRTWGYKAFYEPDGTLVLRLRRPPTINPAAPLRGRRIAIDPGHPPGGATGPTGLTEAEANLAISLRLADQLRARGAEVLLTRSENRSVSLTDRVQMAVDWNADLLISVHNNAFPEGVNPFRNHGTSVYYFHPFSAALARTLDREIADVTRIPDLGAKWSNLALARPTWMPTALTESLYMLMPQQEAALRDPAFLDRLAAAHVRGIENFLTMSAE